MKIGMLWFDDSARSLKVRIQEAADYYSEKYGMTVPVPSHPGDVPKGLLRKIIKEMGISVEKFNEL